MTPTKSPATRSRAIALASCLVAGLSLLPGQWVSAAPTFEVAATINVTFSSQVTASDRYAFVASDTEVVVIDSESNSVVRRVSTSGALSPQDGAVVGNKVYFANVGSDNLTILDMNTWTVSYLPTIGCSLPVSLLPLSSTRMVVDCRGSDAIQVINTSTDRIIQTVGVGPGSRGMSANGNVVFVPNSFAGSVSIVNTNDNPTTAVTVLVGTQPEWTAYLDGKIYVANFGANTVSILNGSSPYSAVATVPVGTQPQGIDPCAGMIFTANRDSGSTSVISPATNSVTNTIALAGAGAITHVMGVNGNYAFFLNFTPSTVSVVDCVTNTVAATVPSAPSPGSIAFSRAYAYVAGTNQLTAITLPASQGGGSQSSPTVTLTLNTTSGYSCSTGQITGDMNTWMLLPTASDCSPPTAKPRAVLLGWSTSPDFPVAIAQRQVDHGWGVYETFDSTGQLTGVFIPVGRPTWLSSPGQIYSIWSE